MIGKITPLVQEAGWQSWIVANTLHILGAALAAAFSGWFFGFTGQVLGLSPSGPLMLLLPVVLAAIAVLDAGVTPWSMPRLPRQTPAWLPCYFGPIWSALLWGLDLGLGWSTHTCFATFFGAATLVLWIGSPMVGAITLSAYGVGRGLPVIVAGIVAQRVPVNTLVVQLSHTYLTLRFMNLAALSWVVGFVGMALFT